MNLASRFKQQFIHSHTRGLALDIDETLSWTVGFWVEKLQELFGNPENLTPHELVKKYRYTQNVPYWQTKEALQWMEDHRHKDDIQEMLPLIEHADRFVQEINKIVPIVAYITTRPESVVNGTKKWLEKHHFPQATIVAKPLSIPTAEGNKWKAHVLEELYPEVIGIIEDNPGVVNNLSADYQGVVYLYDNIDHPRKDSNVIPCETWNDVLKGVAEDHK
jgi:hypothetical protein